MLDFITRIPEAPWLGEGPHGRPARLRPAMPRLQDVVIVVPLSDHRLAVRKGTAAQIAAVIQDLPEGPAACCLGLMDGTRTWPEIVATMQACYPQIVDEALEEFFDGLHDVGVLDDAATGVPDLLTADDLRRYSRNLNCWSAMPSGFVSKYHVQAHLRRSAVMILGVGGLGSNCALGLAMLGIGHLILVDHDVVELQNLNRQVLYDTASVGRSKVLVGAERLRAVNPTVRVSTIAERIVSPQAVERLIREFDPHIVVLAADRPVRTIDRWTSEACVRTGVPYITGGVNGARGRIWSKVPGETGCDECDRLWLGTPPRTSSR
jgi:molybdopterin/thiamine biosynthesis adenylyltransferase